jgi:hypothetical protein
VSGGSTRDRNATRDGARSSQAFQLRLGVCPVDIYLIGLDEQHPPSPKVLEQLERWPGGIPPLGINER